jgi:CubicO group peptidase (beta-lactamase class C family)
MKIFLIISTLITLIIPGTNNPFTGNTYDSQSIGITKNDTCKLIDNYLTKLSVEKNFSGGILIINKGKKFFSKGYGWADKQKQIPFTNSTLASMGSITKAFTAAAIMKLAEQNKLSVNDPLKKFFKSTPSDKADITIHQLLTHSSGFHEFLKQDGGDYEIIDKDKFLARAFSEPLAFKPGEKAIYTNVGFSILAIIIEQVSGLSYAQFLKKELFEPVGIKSIGYHFPVLGNDTIAVGYQNGNVWGTHQKHFEEAGGGPYWNLKGNGGLEASLNDMFIWVNGLTNYKILKESSTEKMIQPYIEEEGYNGTSAFGYGCNISQSMRDTKVIGNGGSNGIYFARLIRLPEEGVSFYMVTNESSMNSNMVLPNVTQLYFQGAISQDATVQQPKFENLLSKKIYEILEKPSVADLAAELIKERIVVDDDMILLEVGQTLTEENKIDRALILYKYYTKTFPQIVVAWNDMGDLYLMQNNKDEAINCFKQALKIRPENPRAKENLNKLLR